MTSALTVLLAEVIPSSQTFGLQAESAPGSEAFVLLTLGILGFLFASFVFAGYVLWRRETKPAPHTQLLMELESEETAEKLLQKAGRDEAEPKPWERDSDWWKRE
jgi:hypothetical protein